MGRRLTKRMVIILALATAWSLFWWLMAFAQMMQEAGRS